MDPEIDRMFRDRPEVKKKEQKRPFLRRSLLKRPQGMVSLVMTRSQDHYPHMHEAKYRRAIWDLTSRFNLRKLKSIHRWYRTSMLITLPWGEDQANLPLARHIMFTDAIMRCEVYLLLHL